MPKEECFFDYFEEHCALTVEACRELVALAEPGNDVAAKAGRIGELEAQTDTITHRCIKALRQTFITPFDRTQIHALIKGLDDIVDAIDDASSRIVLYEIAEMRPEVSKIALLILQAAMAIFDALKQMRNLKNEAAINRICILIHGYENDADEIYRSVLKQLFHEDYHVFEVMKWKEIIELLEMATDRCEDVADIIQGIIIEAS